MSDSSYYLWEVEGCPLAVNLSLALIDQLGQAARQFPIETAGLLFGKWTDAQVVEIDDYNPSPDTAPRPDQSVIGYFRMRTAEGPCLDKEDQSAIRKRFPGRPAVALAIRHNAASPPSAAIFFWDGKSLNSRYSTLPFSFDRDLLISEGHPLIHPESADPDQTVREARFPLGSRAWMRPAWKGLGTEAALFAVAALLVWGAVLCGKYIRGAKGTAATQGSVTNAAVVPPPLPLNAAQPALPPVIAEPLPSEELPSSAGQSALKNRVAAAGEKAEAPALRRKTVERPVEVRISPMTKRTENVAKDSAKPFPQHRSGADISLQPVHRTLLGKALHHMPLLSRFEHDYYQDDFVPARVIKQTPPLVPLALQRRLKRDVPVDLRIHIAKSGAVAETQLISRNVSPAFSSLALHAAAQWDFEPARIRNKAVPSDMLVHFRFRPSVQ